ncbi:MAG: hypothetical protein ACK43N_10260, partial [Pirellulaceae bacterium]
MQARTGAEQRAFRGSLGPLASRESPKIQTHPIRLSLDSPTWNHLRFRGTWRWRPKKSFSWGLAYYRMVLGQQASRQEELTGLLRAHET